MLKTKNRQNNFIFFNAVLFLLFLSFFEESQIWRLSSIALVAVFLIPAVIAAELFVNKKAFNAIEKTIVAAFALFAFFQLFGIGLNSFYKSLTPIYRTFSALAVVIYVRRINIGKYERQSINVLSAVTLAAGLISFCLPEQSNGNPFFGNLNTVGVLYFTVFAINYLLFVKTKNLINSALCCFAVFIIAASNTRTALFLAVLTVAVNLIVYFTKLKKISPFVFYALSFAGIALFVLFYFNIRNLSVYNFLNAVSQKLFHKNLDSGRPELWHLTIEAVGDRFLSGRGNFAELSDFASWTKTPHSVFFDVYLKNGLSGLFFFVLAITVVLQFKGNYENNRLNVLNMSLVFVILFYNAVGIVLTKPRSGIGLIQWMLIALPYLSSAKLKLKDSLLW